MKVMSDLSLIASETYVDRLLKDADGVAIQATFRLETHPLTGLCRVRLDWSFRETDWPMGQVWRGPVYDRRPLPRV